VVVSEAAAIATLPLVVRVLFIACVAMLVGNALVLILNLEIMESADSNVDHERSRSHIDLLSPFLVVDAATAEPEYLTSVVPLADLDPALVAKRRYIGRLASRALLISKDGIQVNDGLGPRVPGLEKLTRLQQTIPADGREGPDSALQGTLADRSSRRNLRDEGATTRLLEPHNPQAYGRFRSTVLVGMIVNAAAIAVLILFYLLIQRSFARQVRLDATLKSHNRNLEATVAQRARELSELSGHLIRVAEEEKARLARDLHDELGASLTAMKFDMAYVAAKLKDSAPPLADRLQRAIDTLRCTFDLKRRLVQDLWPTMLDHLGLAAAVRAHCNEFTLRTGVPCVADIAEGLNMDPGCSIALYRVVQESLTNIAKYAQASNVTVVLKREREGLTLQVSDNGIGISVDASNNKSGSYGIVGMRERISQLRGTFAISPRPEEGGTVVEAFIPLAAVRFDPERIFPVSVTLPPPAETVVLRASTSAQIRIGGNRSQSSTSRAHFKPTINDGGDRRPQELR
jgi:signal transduction histidine kinase